MTVPQVGCGWPSPATLTHKGPDGQLSAEQHPDLLKLGRELLPPRLLIPQQGFCPLQLHLQLRAKHLESGAGGTLPGTQGPPTLPCHGHAGWPGPSSWSPLGEMGPSCWGRELGDGGEMLMGCGVL